MALRWIDGFEGYGTTGNLINSGMYTGVPNSIVSGRFGGSAVRIDDTNNGLNVLFDGAPLTAGVIGFAFKATNNNPTSGAGLAPRVHFSNSVRVVFNKSSGRIQIATSDTVIALTGNGVYDLTAWQYIEIVFSSSQLQVFVNGTLDLTYVAAIPAQSFIQFDAVASHAFDLDDLYILDTTGSVNNARLGDCRVETRFPTADISSTDWTLIGAPAAWEALDDTAQDGDTTALRSSVLNAQALVTSSTPLSNNPDAIFGVMVSTVARRDDTGFRSTRILSSDGTNTVESGDYTLSNSYQTQRAVFETAPDGLGWTRAKVEAHRFGIKNQA